ncbi:DUF962 domain-containing protein [Telmatospirillum siberiense]|uniref:DUF962 domain-containing protein n=1 Tax=Telmatospirillum siberiense TaxID=382514 RepID=A0A2N3PW20_9PROT|nr:Mpo1-like protein [Telmatospirillum siberiense]PKU24575.1 hypothetical protein CWS72_10775 [Telmatospirillum siberiense]
MTSLAKRMASYGRYHRDRRNRLTHFVGVPLIIFALLIAMSLARLTIGGMTLTAAEIFIAGALAYYLALDAALALALAAVILPMLWMADRLAARDGEMALIISAGLLLGGWAFQLLGHRIEGNRPALLDNIFQIFAAPIFLAGEAAFHLGYRSELRREVERRIASGDFTGDQPR